MNITIESGLCRFSCAALNEDPQYAAASRFDHRGFCVGAARFDLLLLIAKQRIIIQAVTLIQLIVILMSDKRSVFSLQGIVLCPFCRQGASGQKYGQHKTQDQYFHRDGIMIHFVYFSFPFSILPTGSATQAKR